MPPGRPRKSNNSIRAQPTLSFNSRSAKITKPSIATASRSSKGLTKQDLGDTASVSVSTSSPAPEDVDAQTEEQPTTAELAIREQIEQEQKTRNEAEERAEKISDPQVRRYWKAKEEGRKAPRVHQQGLTLEDKILREFDLSYQFGPCVGISRTKRWRRAEKLGLKPPIEVLAVLMKQDAKNVVAVQRAYVEELMSSKYVTN